MYVATQRDVTWDLSYFRTARPGESTKKIVRGLNEPLQVTLFFPPANEVGEAVAQYFRELARSSAQLQVERLDQAVEPTRARTLGVTTNGVVVLSRGEQREVYTVGLEIERARGQLQRLDQEVQQRLLTVARPRRVVYFTDGPRRARRRAGRAGRDAAPGHLLSSRSCCARRTWRLQNVSVAEGLGSEVPRDATAVVIIGPTKEFLPEEVARPAPSTSTRAAGCGSRWIPRAPAHEALLKPLGLKYLNDAAGQ